MGGESSGGGGGTEAAAAGRRMSLVDLPEGCIVHILSFTSPVDVCRCAMVSSFFRSLASTDVMWERFLPSDYVSILQSSPDPPSFYTKKGLFRTLCTRPIVFDHGKKSLCLDTKSGNKCYMLAARDLTIESSDSAQHWAWIKHNGSRFPEVAELKSVPALDIRGQITTSMLSPATTYVVYLVYKFERNVFDCLLVDVSVGIAGTEILAGTVCLKADVERHNHHQYSSGLLGVRRPKSRRSDGWLEIELGQYSDEGRKNCGSEAISIQVKGGPTQGCVIIQGMEIRPTNWETGQKTDWQNLLGIPKELRLHYVEPKIVNGALFIPKEVIEAGIKQWSSSLVGQFVGKNPPPLHKIRAMANRFWGREGQIIVGKMPSSPMYLFQFPSEAVSSRICEGGPWYYDKNTPLLLRKWVRNIQPVETGEMTVPVRNNNKLKSAKPTKQVWVVKKTEEEGGNLSKVDGQNSAGKPMNQTDDAIESVKPKDVPESSRVNDRKSSLKGKAVSSRVMSSRDSERKTVNDKDNEVRVT